MSVFTRSVALAALDAATRSPTPKHVSGRAARGLFAGRDKSFGNNVSFSKRKCVFSFFTCGGATCEHLTFVYSQVLRGGLCGSRTRRDWKVNHQWKHLYSEALDEKIGLNVTTHTLRCIDKAGGLDNYLLGLKKESDLGVKGLAARDRIAEVLATASAAP